MSGASQTSLTGSTNLSQLREHATTVRAVNGSGLGGGMRAEPCSALDELSRLSDLLRPAWPYAFEKTPSAIYDVVDGHVLLSNTSELVYALPANTTLVEVLGPVGSHGRWRGNAECYATLTPRPPWWRDTNFPRSSSVKGRNATDQTMFLLPTPPDVQYTLHVGAFGQHESCAVAAVRTYPFRL